MKKKIRDYVFVADSFGPLPVWSLMHPEKEAADAYALYPRKMFPKIIKKELALAMSILRNLDKHFAYMDVYITGKMEYEHVKDVGERVVTNLDIESITLYPTI